MVDTRAEMLSVGTYSVMTIDTTYDYKWVFLTTTSILFAIGTLERAYSAHVAERALASFLALRAAFLLPQHPTNTIVAMSYHMRLSYRGCSSPVCFVRVEYFAQSRHVEKPGLVERR